MNDLKVLTELAGFVTKSPLLSENVAGRQIALNGLVTRLQPRPFHRKATDLLGVVMALSARTRRISQQRVGVDIDCFAPNGGRAVEISMGPK